MGPSLLATFSTVPPAGFGARLAWSRAFGRLAAPWRAWGERRRAGACAREVMRLDRMVKKIQPWLSREERQRKVVESYMVCDPADAAALLRCAEASFATWPVRRELSLRDLAHYLAVSELLITNGDAGVHASLKPVIDATIPAGL